MFAMYRRSETVGMGTSPRLLFVEECFMFSDYAQPHPSNSDTPESKLRFGMMLAELWHDWFEAMSHVAYQTHRACDFLAENGGPANGPFGPFDFRASHSPSEGSNGSVDMDKLKQCLHAMDPMQAAQVMHAVQTMQAMEAMLKRSKIARERGRGGSLVGLAWQRRAARAGDHEPSLVGSAIALLG